MRQARRVIAILVSCATWCLAASSAAFAMLTVPQGGSTSAPAATIATGTSLWAFLGLVALEVLMAVAIVGLGFSLSRAPRPQTPRDSQPSLRA